MTAPSMPPQPMSSAGPARPLDDPDEYRMSVGDHIEELRRRIIIGLIGFAVAAGVCFLFGRQVTSIFCRPLSNVLRSHDLPPNLYTRELSDAFMTYIEISLVTAGAISAPWMLYQLWQFVAAGLYPHERKYITRYAPVSMFLLISGMVFLYFVVLPMVLNFFLLWTLNIPMLGSAPQVPSTQPAVTIPQIAGEPIKLVPFQVWFDTYDRQLKVYVVQNGDGRVHTIPFGTDSLTTPLFDLREYVDLVLRLLLIFGIAFQLPLVVMALVHIGIVELAALRAYRRYVYFAITVLAGVLTPGDVVTAMLALLAPMIVLYELGILLAAWGANPPQPESPDAAT